MKINKRLGLIIGVVVAATMGLLHAPIAQAAPIDSVPQGIPVGGQPYFDVPSVLGKTGKENSAKVVNVPDSANHLPMDAVQLTAQGTHDAGGAIWSKKPSFDLSKNQTFSMWIYSSADVTTSPGEGMAFVLHNNNEGNQFSGTGEALGVWGADPKSTKGGADIIAGQAIPNSWALEFDTELNNVDPSKKWDTGSFLPTLNYWDLSANQPSAFDLGQSLGYSNSTGNTTSQGLTREHISSGYPADGATYEADKGYGKNGLLSSRQQYYYYKQTHFGLITDGNGTLLSDRAWHHVTLNYTAPAAGSTVGTMDYRYDDKNPTTGAKQSSNRYVITNLDISKLGLTGSSSRVYWGMTGSTGQTWSSDSVDKDDGTQDSLVAFEHVPGQANGSATAKLTDTTDNRVVASGDTIKGGDAVKLDYTVKYDSGDTDWTNVMAQLHVPKGIRVTSGHVTAADGSTSRSIDMSKLQGAATTGQSIEESVGTLSSGSQTATITLTGKMLNDKAYSVPDTTSNFVGSGTMASASVSRFSSTVQDLPAFSLIPDQTTIHVNKGETPVVTGRIERGDGLPIISSNIQLSGWLVNKETGVNAKIKTITLDDKDNPASGFKYTAVPEIGTFAPGSYELKLQAVDGKNGYIEDVTLTIIIGDVDFGSTSGNLTYTADLTGSDQTVSRSDPNWSFNIDDTAKKGTTWQLYAQASTLTSKTAALDGELVYSDGQNSQPQPLSAKTLITDHGSDGTTTPFNIASDWTDQSGILLKVHGGAMKGDYEGTITWTLEDSIDANH
ncbi:hypothetical protein [Levilactobacillus fuyuanensis]|uniref:WxL domain-containing protein n=1 Tax=Levilactobacillus fuyuanensis TaxID=2486022 RepID=A0ABW4H4W8_9LACO|nr:hypothetical protein [Levilactobacillus fuyuanensis]